MIVVHINDIVNPSLINLHSGQWGHLRGEEGSPVLAVVEVKGYPTGVFVVLNVGPDL